MDKLTKNENSWILLHLRRTFLGKANYSTLEKLSCQAHCDKRRAFIFLVLTTVFFIAYYSVASFTFFDQQTTQYNKTKSVLSVEYLSSLEDISAKYEIQKDKFTNVDDVLLSLIRDGYDPVPVSKICSRPLNDKTLKTFTSEASTQSNNLTQLNTSIMKSNFLVPNVVHYTFFGTFLQFSFTNYLSLLSVGRFIKPDQIFIYGEAVPSGQWWNQTIMDVKNIYHVKTTLRKEAPNGQLFKYPAHISDYMRAETLVRYGGVYLDSDVLVLKSFDLLRKYPAVLGRETQYGLCTGIIVAQKGSPILRMMLEQYRSYRGLDEPWAALSIENLHTLAGLFPHLVHIEETSLNRPNWMQPFQIYNLNYDWSNNYAMHIWVRSWPKALRPSRIEDAMIDESTFGEMARYILSGSKNGTNSMTRSIRIGLLLQI